MVLELNDLETISLVIGIVLSTLGVLSIVFAAGGKIVFKTISEPIGKAKLDIDKLCLAFDGIRNEILALRNDIVDISAELEIAKRRMEYLTGEVADHEERMRLCETITTIVKYKCDWYKDEEVSK